MSLHVVGCQCVKCLPSCWDVNTVTVTPAAGGRLLRVEHDGDTLTLDRDEVLALIDLLNTHVGAMPVSLSPNKSLAEVASEKAPKDRRPDSAPTSH